MLTQERVKELFDYREDGQLIRKVRTSNCINIGDVAGSPSSKGYLGIWIDGRSYLNHRLIFLFHHGYLPEGFLDHRDKDKLNNRIKNLREASPSCNAKNRKQMLSTSGVKGISWHKDRRKWTVQIKVDGKKSYVGLYIDFTEAVCHRLAAEQCLNWNECDSDSPAWRYIYGKK